MAPETHTALYQTPNPSSASLFRLFLGRCCLHLIVTYLQSLMEEDDFGDLYTDVTNPLEPSASSNLHLPLAPPHHPSPPIEPKLQSKHQSSFHVGFQSASNLSGRQSDQTLAPHSDVTGEGRKGSPPASRVSERDDDKLPDDYSDNANFGEIAGSNDDAEMKFDIEETYTENEPVIPGLSLGGDGVESASRFAADKQTSVDSSTGFKDGEKIISGGNGIDGERDASDSDSEDDMQIVLNENNRHATSRQERGAAGGGDDDEDDDDDEDPLVIVADVDRNHAMEEQEWGEDAAQDGERKESGEAGKASGGAAAGPKIGYSNHVYHPFHSQFKYVRPGAAPTAGGAAAGTGAPLGQVRPLVNAGAMAGRGRGDWRPPGMKNAPMQKGYQPGFGVPWGGNAGRGFGGGLEFTLPSHKTIFEVDIDAFEEKPWKYPGIDLTDFFNFGLNEESWKDYCKQLEQHRLETTMQSRIRVYESGRTEQGYDPDLPPELAAAAANRDVQADSTNFGKPDIGGTDPSKDPARMRPQLPTGRAIQVETGYGERLPSIDTRPPRTRDSDAIIEIVCQDSFGAPSNKDGTEKVAQPVEGILEGRVADHKIIPGDAECSNGPLDSYSGQRRELGGRLSSRNAPMSSGHYHGAEGDGNRSLPPNEPNQFPPGSRVDSPVYLPEKSETPRDERRTHGKPYCSSPEVWERQKKRELDEDLKESRDGASLRSSSPAAVRNGSKSPSFERKDVRLDARRGSAVEELTKSTTSSRMFGLQEDGLELQAERSSENSKARSGSSRDYHKLKHGMEDEVMQDRHHGRVTSKRKHFDENDQHHRRRHHDGRLEIEKARGATKLRNDSVSHKDTDPSLVHQPNMKSEDFDKRKEREVSDGAWRKKDDEPYSRRSRDEDSRKRDRGDDLGTRHKSRTRESERGKHDEHNQARRHLDHSSSKGQDLDARHKERDDHMRSRHEAAGDYHNKRRKDEEYLRRTRSDKEDIVRSQRESSNRPKRERENPSDQKREGQQRSRDGFDDQRSTRLKDESHIQRDGSDRRRDREELHKSKKIQEEVPSKRERDRRSAARSQHSSEDRTSKLKDEPKGSIKDTVSNVEQRKRRDQANLESSLHHRGHDASARSDNNEGKTRQEKSGIRIDHGALENPRIQEKKSKELSRKSKESGNGDMSTHPKAKHEDQTDDSKEMVQQGNVSNEAAVHLYSGGKCKDDGSAESSKSAVDTSSLQDLKVNEQPHSEKAVSGAESKDANKNPLGDRHLDTVEKLKKRSERFKLPMPNEKDPSVIKKMENEALPSTKDETQADPDVKPERPARKRRWTSGS